MEQDTTSFRVDIKRYEELLAKDPNSYCFAPLAELYRKLGLLDDAISVAKQGCEIHPDYVGGYMALGRAYFEKGLKRESRDALEKVVKATPDNLLAHRLLSQIYMEAEENSAAENALRAVLSLNPDDLEARVALDSLSGASAVKPASALGSGLGGGRFEGTDAVFADLADEEHILEDLEIIEELDEEEPAGEEEEALFGAPADVFAKEIDPFKTATLAELYVTQGFLDRAIDIYRELLGKDPHNAEYKNRLTALNIALDKELPAAGVPDLCGAEGPALWEGSVCPAVRGDGSISAGEGNKVLDTLETWLVNIRRRR